MIFRLRSRAPRTQADLRLDSQTLCYEVAMLLGSALRYPAAAPEDQVARNMAVEAFALHCRALILFLFGHLDEITANGQTARFAPERPNDVFAFDFYPGWAADCPAPTEVLVEAKWRADK